MIVEQFEELVEQSAKQPLVMAVSLHTFITGQPMRLRPVRQALKHCAQHKLKRSRLVYARRRHRQLLLHASAGYDRRQLACSAARWSNGGRNERGCSCVCRAYERRCFDLFASDNVRHLCRMELPGGGQIVIQGQYAFVGHQHGPDGTTILDISDPRRPKIVSKLMTSHPWSHSHKVRVVGDLMVVNSEIEPGAGDRLAYPDGGFRIYDIKRQGATRS